jgi:hypothetical protein
MQDREFDTRSKNKPGLSKQVVERRRDEHEAQSACLPQCDSFEPVIRGIGNASSAGLHASMLNRATGGRTSRAVQSLLRLQRQYGNRYVQKVLALAGKNTREAEIAPGVEQNIQQARGDGHGIDSKVRTQMESAFGADFSDVRLHTDTQADILNRELNARAFTTGQDIFFRQGASNFGSSSGRELLAHELTHVVQQCGDKVQRKLTVGQQGDKYEQEADEAARTVMQGEKQATPQETVRGYYMHKQAETDEGLHIKTGVDRIQRQVEEREEEENPIQTKVENTRLQQRVEDEEEEKSIHAKAENVMVQRQIEGEGKKNVQMKEHSNSKFQKKTLCQQAIKTRTERKLINRWAAHEHKAFGDLAANMATAHKDKFQIIIPNTDKKDKEEETFGELSKGFNEVTGELTEELKKGGKGLTTSKQGIDIEYGSKGKAMSLGTGTMIGGDYIGSSGRFTEIESVNPKEISGYLALAATNINHFFPLAAKEWRRQHGKAIGLADQAGKAYQAGNKAKGNTLKNLALQTEAFGLHFLQDSFASGHQYPRALEAVHSGWQRFALNAVKSQFIQKLGLIGMGAVVTIKLLGFTDDKILSAIKGLQKSKVYHDALCCLPNGLDMLYGQKFHGDYTANQKDYPVAEETYNSLLQVLSAICMTESPGKEPRPNSGPDVGKIMNDNAARPIWYALEHSIEGMLEEAEAHDDGTVKTDSGFQYKISDILLDWEGGRWEKGEQGEKRKKQALSKLNADLKEQDMATRLVAAALKGQESLTYNAAKSGDEFYYGLGEEGKARRDNPLNEPGQILGIGTGTDLEADDAIIAELTNKKTGKLESRRVPVLTAHQTVIICQALISGVCIGDDEHAVLYILKKQNKNVFRSAVDELTPSYIDKGLDWEEWDNFLLLCAHNYPAGKNRGARLIFSEKNDDAARMLINGGKYASSVPMSNLSDVEWIGVIKALLKGVCGDDDEDAIVKIVKYLVLTRKRAKLIHCSIGPSEMDKGVDGKQWGEIRAIMKKGGIKWSWWG